MKALAVEAWRRVRRLPWLVWLVLFLVSTTVSLLALRHNNLQTVYLRNQVYSADKSGQGLNQALNSLRSYVTAHMNTDLNSPNGIYPPIQLSYTYDRLKSQATSNIYHDAQVYCEKVEPNGFYGQSRLNCVEPYIEAHPLTPADIPTALYEFDFVSPTWSPDLAGWSLVASSGLLIGFLVSFVSQRLGRR